MWTAPENTSPIDLKSDPVALQVARRETALIFRGAAQGMHLTEAEGASSCSATSSGIRGWLPSHTGTRNSLQTCCIGPRY